MSIDTREDSEYIPITVKIDSGVHYAMKRLAKRRMVNISYLYGEALEKFLLALAPVNGKKGNAGGRPRS